LIRGGRVNDKDNCCLTRRILQLKRRKLVGKYSHSYIPYECIEALLSVTLALIVCWMNRIYIFLVFKDSLARFRPDQELFSIGVL